MKPLAKFYLRAFKDAASANGKGKFAASFAATVRRNVLELATSLNGVGSLSRCAMWANRNTLPALFFKKLITSNFVLEKVVELMDCFELEYHFIVRFVSTKLGDVTHNTKSFETKKHLKLAKTLKV